jgi:hypothetical protein
MSLEPGVFEFNLFQTSIELVKDIYYFLSKAF